MECGWKDCFNQKSSPANFLTPPSSTFASLPTANRCFSPYERCLAMLSLRQIPAGHLVGTSSMVSTPQRSSCGEPHIAKKRYVRGEPSFSKVMRCLCVSTAVGPFSPYAQSSSWTVHGPGGRHGGDQRDRQRSSVFHGASMDGLAMCVCPALPQASRCTIEGLKGEPFDIQNKGVCQARQAAWHH